MEIKVKNAADKLSEIKEIVERKWPDTEIREWPNTEISVIENDVVIKGEDNQIGWANTLSALAHKGFDAE